MRIPILHRRRLVLWLFLLAAGSVYVFFLDDHPSQRTEDGRILIDLEFVRNVKTPKLFRVIDSVLGWTFPSALTLDKSSLKAAAHARCGGTSFWIHPYGEEALTALTSAFETDKPPLTNLGRAMLHENYVTSLCVQVEVNRILTEHPDILDERIDALVIAGGARTGSTHLMSLLCRHPNATCLTLAESTIPLSPVSRAEDILTWKDARLLRTKAAAWIVLALRPLFSFMFKFEALQPMEEIQLGTIVFGSSVFLTQALLPSYNEWFMRTDHTPMEEYIKTLLKIIQYQRRGGGGGGFSTGKKNKMWILKSPQNSNQLGPKTRVFPDAKLVFTHRTPVPMIQSMIGMTMYTVGIFNDPEKFDFPSYARMWLLHHKWTLVDRLAEKQVQKYVKDVETTVMNVQFNDFMRDPVETAIKVAEHAGLMQDDERKVMLVRELFAKFQQESPQEGSKKLKYDLASFGIDEKEVDDLFAPYVSEYLT